MNVQYCFTLLMGNNEKWATGEKAAGTAFISLEEEKK